MSSLRWKLGAVCAFLLTATATAQIGPGPFAAFPTANPVDARFLGFGCAGIATFEQGVTMVVAIPADQASFTLSVFDGDTGGVDAMNKQHWDVGNHQLVYSLYADPLRTGNPVPANLIGSWTGNAPNSTSGPLWTASAATMPDNDWWGVTVTTSPIAQAVSGNFFYLLTIGLDSPCAPLEATEANIKIAASNPLLFQVPRFGLVAALRQIANDGPIVYPGTFPPPGNDFVHAPTTYDGTFNFFFKIPGGGTDLQLYDGDFDVGTGNLVGLPSGTVLTPCVDTDDPDTDPLYTGFPFSTAGANPEAINSPGNPADDSAFDIFRRGEPSSSGRVGCVRYEVKDPNGTIYRNDNPSGSFEWEQFRIATPAAVDAANSDYVVGALPGGIWNVKLIGLDLSNLNFFFANACGVRQDGNTTTAACVDLSVYLLGDTVWLDKNGNGVQDMGEPGIPGVKVNLLNPDTLAVVDTVTTADTGQPNWAACVVNNTGLDEQGLYCHGVDTPGDYLIQIAAENFQPGGALEGLVSTTGGESQSNTLVDSNVLTYDFGYLGTASLGDRVWLDTDGDGMQDSGETGINGVKVELLDDSSNVIKTTTTSGDGNYTFTQLEAGTYSVRIVTSTLPAGLEETYDLDGTGSADIATADLGPGQHRTDVDFGYRGTASVGDRVWHDVDADGVQDSGEAGLNGITVELRDSGGNVVATQTTSGDGNYLFDHLTAGTYTVRVVSSTVPPGYLQTYDLDGTGTPHQATFSLAAGQDRTDVDFGYRNPAVLSVGDRVWNDVDGDGVQDTGEAGLNGVTVQLLNSGGTVIATQVTSGNGNYTFSSLTPGTYTVRVVSSTVPTGYTQTYDLDGLGTPHQATFSLTANRTDVDFGYRAPTCTAGTMKDTFTTAGFSNNEGTLSWSGDWIEYDVAGAGPSSGNVTVGTPVAGYMIFRDSPDTGTQPSAARQANLSGFSSATLTVDFHIRGVETDDAAVIEVSKDGGATYTVLETLTGLTGTYISSRTYDISAYMASNTRIRFRISQNYGGDDDFFKVDTVRIDASCTPAPKFSVGDRVWSDSDGDGVQETGEAGLNGVTVQLLNSGGALIATQTTSGNGNYSFTGLAAGTYTVRVVSSTVPAGYSQTYDLDGTGTAHQATFSLAANRTDVDFGYRAPTCTAGYFKDTFTTAGFSNNEGTLSWSGAWIEYDVAGAGPSSGNVTVGTPVAGYMIFRDSPDTGTQPSAARQVNLTGFASATLTVDFHIRGVETDDAAVIEVSKDGGATYTVLETLTGLTGTYISSRTYDISAYKASNTRIRFRISANYGGSDDFFKVDTVQIDAGCTTQQTGSIGDRVWKDSDADGVQDSGEAGLNGVTVQLLNSGGTVLATQTTSGNGNYLFSGLAAGTYKVKVVSSTLPSGYVQTYDLDGTSTAHTATATLAVGQNRTDVDFGYRPPTCTAGYFLDTFDTASFSNNNGTLSWSAAWVESDTAGTGVSSGNVTVGTPFAGYLILDDNPDTGTQPSAARQANLAGFTAATLKLDFHTKEGVDPDDAAVVEVSKDGGATYTVLETFTNITGKVISSRTYNISSYIASNTRIRFRISANYGGSDEMFKVDQVRIDASCQ